MNVEQVKRDVSGKIREHLKSFGYEYGADQVQHVEAGISSHIIGIPEVPDSGRYKCLTCYLILRAEQLIDGNCPECHSNDNLQPMCPKDTVHCNHDKTESLAYCDVCGKPVCPECGCHDVAQFSRITGYIQDVGGWNAGKAQELKDRHRVNIE